MKPGKTKARETKRRLLIVDDHPIMRQGLAQLINNEPDLSVCAEAENARSAVEAIATAKPDLALVDITLPDKDGLELIKDLHALHPTLPMLVLSMHDETLYTERVLRAGGRGYIMKQEGGKKLMQAIRQVLEGGMYVSEKMSAKILEIFSGRQTGTKESPIGKLTDREFEVFQQAGLGKGTREIAGRLHLSVKTVEAHRANIKRKLGLKTATEFVRSAVRWMESQNSD